MRPEDRLGLLPVRLVSLFIKEKLLFLWDPCIPMLVFVKTIWWFFRMMLSQGLRPVRFIRILIKYKPSDIQTGCLGMSVRLAIIVLRVKAVT